MKSRATTALCSRQSDASMIRFPEGVRARLKEEAKKAGRSMNSEIGFRLMASLGMEAPVAVPNRAVVPAGDRIRLAELFASQWIGPLSDRRFVSGYTDEAAAIEAARLGLLQADALLRLSKDEPA